MEERETRRFARAVKGTAEPIELPGDSGSGAVLLSRDREPRGLVVIAHGGGNHRFFGLHYLVRVLLDSGFDSLTAHLAGHGRGRVDTFTLENARARMDALVAWARGSASERVVVVLGQSLGGSLALDQLARGTAGDAVIAVSAPADLRTNMRLGLELGCLLKPAVYRAVRYAGPWGALPAYRGFRRKAFPVRAQNGENYLDAFADAVEEMALEKRLDSIETALPVLLVHGERDGVVPCSQASSLAEALGSAAQLCLEPGVRHLDPLLYRRVVARIVRWLQELPRGSRSLPNPAIDGE